MKAEEPERRVGCSEATNSGSLCIYLVSKKVGKGEREIYAEENGYGWRSMEG